MDEMNEEDRKHIGMRKLTGQTNKFYGCFGDRRMILFIVFVALFLDNMLLTTVVPIIPDFLIVHNKKLLNLTIQKLLNKQNDNCSNYITNITNENNDLNHKNSIIWASRGHYRNDALIKLPNKLINQMNRKSDQIYNRLINNTYYECKKKLENEIKQIKHEHLGNEHIQVGLMFASKAVIQLIVNPLIGPLTNRIGYSIPMFTGFVIMFTSTIVFAFGESYAILFVARALQGVGSACSSVSGMGMLATCYVDDKERSRAFSWALSGLAMGVLVGPPFGGICYQFINKEAPFLILASLAMFDGILQLIALKPAVRPESEKGSALLELLRDPYILIAAGSITFGNMGIAMLEPTLPLWMWDKMHSQGWEQGVAFLPCSISYLIGTNTFGPIAHKIGRGLSAGVGMVICGICLIAIPFCSKLGHLIVPMFGLGFAIGMVDSSMMPIMGYLVDLRHVAVYGSVYAIADVAFCLGFAIGPILSGAMVKGLGFSWMLWSISIICLIYSPLTLFLRNPPRRDEVQSVINDKNKLNESDEMNMRKSIIPSIQLGSTLGYDPTSNGKLEYKYN